MADSADQRLIPPAWIATGLLAGAMALGLVWLKSGLVGSDRWPINWLEVEGDLDRTTSAQVRAAVAPHAGSGFFAVDIARVRDSVESLPWVSGAEVSRHWPDALSVNVVEHRPVARWNETGLISRQGELFDVAGTSGMQGLPRLVGPDTRRLEVLEAWMGMRRRLAAHGMDVQAVELDARGAWRVELDGGLVLLLGREQIDQRLARFLAVRDRLMQLERNIAVVDLRYTNGLAVRRAENEGDIELARTGEQGNHG